MWLAATAVAAAAPAAVATADAEADGASFAADGPPLAADAAPPAADAPPPPANKWQTGHLNGRNKRTCPEPAPVGKRTRAAQQAMHTGVWHITAA